MLNKDCEAKATRGKVSQGGYTLQTLIISAILVAGAVAASVIIFRVIQDNADFRSLTDLTGTQAPTRALNLEAEPILIPANPDTPSQAAVRISWSPPIFTGHQTGTVEIAVGSPDDLRYQIRYTCSADSNAVLGLDDNADGSTPSVGAPPIITVSNVDEAFYELTADAAFSDTTITRGRCLAGVSAYTCPRDDLLSVQGCNSPTPTETYGEIFFGPETQIIFEITRLPSPPTGLSAESLFINNQPILSISWNPPLFYGQPPVYGPPSDDPSPDNSAPRYFYRLSWNRQGGVHCTDVPSYDLANPDSSVYDFAVTLHLGDVPTQAECEGSDIANAAIPGTRVELNGVIYTPIPITQSADIESIELADLAIAQFRTEPAPAPLRLMEELWNFGLAFNINTGSNIDAYELTWQRTDGATQPQTMEVDATTGMTTIEIPIQSETAYDFAVRARTGAEYGEALTFCGAAWHPNRIPAPTVAIRTTEFRTGLRRIVSIFPFERLPGCSNPHEEFFDLVPQRTPSRYQVRILDTDRIEISSACLATDAVLPVDILILEDRILDTAPYVVEVRAGHLAAGATNASCEFAEMHANGIPSAVVRVTTSATD